MSKKQTSQVLIIGCILSLSIGLTASVIGPLIPAFSAKTAASIPDTGMLFSALFLGSLIAQILSGPLSDRLGTRPVLLFGIVLLTVGNLVIPFSSSLTMLLAAGLFGGIGFGIIDLCAHLVIVSAYSSRRVSALNLLNLFFGVGAIAGPALVSFTLKFLPDGLPVFWVIGILLLAVFPFAAQLKIPNLADSPGSETANKSSVYSSPLLWVLGILLLIYVGAENGVGGWATIYLQQTAGLSLDTAAMITSGFWLALTCGRLANTFLGLKLTPNQVLGASLSGSLIGSILLALNPASQPLTIFAILLTGFSYGSIYPTVIAITTLKFPQGAGKAAGAVASLGSLGGVFLPWLQGIVLDKFGAPASAWFTAADALLMILLFVSTYSPLTIRMKAGVFNPRESR